MNSAKERISAQARAELQALYAEMSRELEPFRRYCDARGLCCNFTETGHMLYITTLEASEMAASAVAPQPALSENGLCPYLEGTLCGAREHRAIGCRIYFCDKTYEEDRNALYEKYLKRAREIEANHGIAHTYTPVTKIDFSALKAEHDADK